MTARCTAANGNEHNIIGRVKVPVKMQFKEKICEFLVAPELTQTLILGVDFWIIMGIVPD